VCVCVCFVFLQSKSVFASELSLEDRDQGFLVTAATPEPSTVLGTQRCLTNSYLNGKCWGGESMPPTTLADPG
jgi:hypothetical protein